MLDANRQSAGAMLQYINHAFIAIGVSQQGVNFFIATAESAPRKELRCERFSKTL